MTFRALLPFVLVVIASSAWLYRSRRRKLLPATAILDKLYPGVSDDIERFTAPYDSDLVSDDTEFWNASGGWKGMLQRRHNAVCFVQFCQGLDGCSDIERQEIRRITTRAILISFYSGCSLLEAVVRIFVKDIPHSCARD